MFSTFPAPADPALSVQPDSAFVPPLATPPDADEAFAAMRDLDLLHHHDGTAKSTDPEISAMADSCRATNPEGTHPAIVEIRAHEEELRRRLETYVTDRTAKGRPLFPAQTAATTRARDEFFAQAYEVGLTKLKEVIPAESWNAIELAAKNDPDPDEIRARSINASLFTTIYGGPVPPEQHAAARVNMAVKTEYQGDPRTITDKQLYAHLSARRLEEKKAAELIKTTAQQVFETALAEGKASKTPAVPDGIPARMRPQAREQLLSTRAEAMRLRHQVSGIVKDIVGFTESSRDDPNSLPYHIVSLADKLPDDRDRRNLALAMIGQDLAKLPPDQSIGIVRTGRGLFSGANRTAEGFWGMVDQAGALWEKGTVTAFGTKAQKNAQDSYDAQSRMRLRDKVFALKNAVMGAKGGAFQVNSPDDSQLVTSSIAGAQSLPWTVLSLAGPVGFAFTATSMAGESNATARLRDPDTGEATRFVTSAASGLAQAAVETGFNKFGLKVFQGKVPTLTAILNRTGVESRVGRFAVGAVGAMSTGAGEFTEEVVQDITDNTLQKLATELSGLNSNIDLGEELKAWVTGKGNKARQTLDAILPFMLIAGAGAGVHHFKNGTAYLKNANLMRAVGITEPEIRQILSAPTPENATEQLQTAFAAAQARPKTPEQQAELAASREAYLNIIRQRNELLAQAGRPAITRERNEFTDSDQFVFTDHETGERTLYDDEEKALDSLAQWAGELPFSALETVRAAADPAWREHLTGEGTAAAEANVAIDDQTHTPRTLDNEQSDAETALAAAQKASRTATTPQAQRSAAEAEQAAKRTIGAIQARLKIFLLDHGGGFAGKTPSEVLKSLTVRAKSVADVVGGRIVGWTVRLFQGADFQDIAEDVAESVLKDSLNKGFVDAHEMVEDIRAFQQRTGRVILEPSYQYTPENPVPLVEAFSKLARGYMFTGQAAAELPPSVAKWADMTAAFVAATADIAGTNAEGFLADVSTAADLRRAMAEGYLPERLRSRIADSIALDATERNARHEKSMREQLAAEAMEGFPEIADSLRGKLPHPLTAAKDDEPLAGELRRIWENLIRPSRRRTKTGKEIDRTNEANAYFLPKGQSASLDEVRRALNEDGFAFDTPAEMLEALERSIAYGKRTYGTRGPDFGDMPTFAFSRAVNPTDYKPTAHQVLATTSVSGLTQVFASKSELVPLATDSPMMVSPAYRAAKKGGDMAAAWRIALHFTDGKRIAVWRDQLAGKNPVFVPVTQKEGDMTNLIPLAFAHALQKHIGGRMERGILQHKNGGNTGATQSDRASKTQDFSGTLQLSDNEAVVLVDDTFTSGNTLAALYDHLHAAGIAADYIATIASGRYTKDMAATPEKQKKALDKMGVSEQVFADETGFPIQAFTGAELQGYLLNGERGITGFKTRFLGGTGPGSTRLLPVSADSGLGSEPTFALAPAKPTLPLDPSQVSAYLASNGTPDAAIKTESERISRTLEQDQSRHLAESGAGYFQGDLFLPDLATGRAVAQSAAKAAAKLETKPGTPTVSADLKAGLAGDWAALAREVASRGRASSIIPALIRREIPVWNVVGSIVSSPADVHALMLPIRSPFFESVKVMVLDGNRKVVASQILTVGAINESTANPVEIFAVLTRIREQYPTREYNTIILSHNHPSGITTPSSADERVTRRLNDIARLAGWGVADHVITNGETYYSFAEAGLMGAVSKTREYTPRKDKGTPVPPITVSDRKAPWETVRRSELQLLDSDWTTEKVAAHLRNANPDAAHILYLSTRLSLLGVERIDVSALISPEKFAHTVLAGAGREGAYGAIVDYPLDHSSVDLTKLTDDIRRFSQTTNFKVFNVVGTSNDPAKSPQSNVMEPIAGPTFALAISDLSLIDSVMRRMAAQGPEVRAEVWEKLRDRLAAVNQMALDAKRNQDQNLGEAERERARLKDALLEAQALYNALPSELRARVAFPVSDITGAISAKGSRSALIRFIAAIDDALEHHLITLYREQFERLADLSKPDLRPNKQLRSRLTPETQTAASIVLEVAAMSPDAHALAVQNTEAALAAIDLSKVPPDQYDAAEAEQARLSQYLYALATFGPYSKLDAAGLSVAVRALETIYRTGRYQRSVLDEAKKKEQQQARNEILASLPGTSQRIHAEGKEKTPWLVNFVMGLSSFHQVMEAMLPDSMTVRSFQERIRAASRAAANDAIALRERYDAFTFAAWNLAGSSRLRRRNAIVAKLSELREWNITLAEGVKFEEVKLEEEQALAILEGRMKTGWETDLIAMQALGDALADFRMQRLKAQQEARAFSATVIRFKRLVSRGEPSDLKLSDMGAAYLLQLWAQPQYRPALDKYGFTEDIMGRMAAALDSRANDLLEFMRREYDAEYDRLNPVFRAIHHMDMPRNRNYAPGAFDHMDGAKGSDTISPDGAEPTVNAMFAGFTVARTHHMARPKEENALHRFFQHKAQLTHFIHYAEIVRDIRATLRHPSVRYALESAHGAENTRLFYDWLDDIETDGTRRQKEVGAMQRLGTKILSVRSLCGLAWNIGVLLKQVPAAMGFLMVMPSGAAMRGIFRAMSHPGEYATAVRAMWQSDAIRQRILQGISPEARAVMRSKADSPSVIVEWLAAGLVPNGWVDACATTISAAVAYTHHHAAASRAGLDPAKAHEVAMRYATRVVERTAQPAMTQDKSSVELNPNWIVRYALQFKSDPRQKFAFVAHAIMDYRAKRIGREELVRKIFWGWFAYGLANAAMADLAHAIFRDDDEPDKWDWRDYLASAIAGPLSSAYIVGDAIYQALFTASKSAGGTQGAFADTMPGQGGLSRTTVGASKVWKTIHAMLDDAEANNPTVNELLSALQSTAAGVADISGSRHAAAIAAALRVTRDVEGLAANAIDVFAPSEDDARLDIIRDISKDFPTADTGEATRTLAAELGKLDPSERDQRLAQLPASQRRAVSQRILAAQMTASEAKLASLPDAARDAAIAKITATMSDTEKATYIDRLTRLRILP